jgi:hypothetical protein
VSDTHDRVREVLLSNYRPDESGTWQIFGEDPNCDFGGAHTEPFLATVQGTYAAVVAYALELPGFFTWGGGGRVVPVSIVKVDGETIRQIVVLKSRRQTLKAQLNDVEAELKKLGGA